MVKIQNQELTNKIKEIFKSYMKEKGYEIWKSEDPESGITYTASKESDRYVPLIELCFGREYEFKNVEYEIFIKDRDGKGSLHGHLVANYCLYTKYEPDEEKIINEFQKMLNDAYNEYSKYSRENRLDSVFNNLEYQTFDYLEKDDFAFREWKGVRKRNEVM